MQKSFSLQPTENWISICCWMPGEKPFKTKFLSKQIGTARLSFADGEQMEEYLNITPGSLSLMGLIFDKEKKVHW